MSSGSLVTDRRFGPMFWTQFSGAFNDNFFKNALVILVVYKVAGALPADAPVVFGMGKDAFAPLASAVFILPFFIFSALGGQLADKYEKSQLIRGIKVAEIGIMVLGGFALSIASVELLVLVLFLMGTQSAFFGPVKYGILPQLLDRENLVGGNALVETATYLAILGGTIAGGVLVNVESSSGQPIGVWIVAGGVVLVALLGRFFAGRIVKAPATTPDLKVQLDPVRPTWDIIQITRAKRPVWLSILGITWFWGFGACFLSLFPGYTKDVLGGNEHIATLFLAVFSVGIGLGSMACERFSKHRLELGLVPLGSIGLSAFTLLLVLIGQPWEVKSPSDSLPVLDLDIGVVNVEEATLEPWDGSETVSLTAPQVASITALAKSENPVPVDALQVTPDELSALLGTGVVTNAEGSQLQLRLMGIVEFITRPFGILILLGLVGIAASGGLYIVPLYTMIQQRSDDSERSRVIAGNNIINSAFMVLANVALIGMMEAGLTIPQVFLILAIFNILVAVYVYTIVPEFLLRMAAWLLSNLMYKVELKGIENLPRETRAVVVANHVSFVDWLVVMGAIQRPIRFVMYHGFNKGPLGWLAKHAKVIPIAGRKENPEVFERAFDQISEELQGDWVVGIFPEGRITATGEINAFKSGIEHIIKRDPAPVVPMAINGLWGSMFSRKEKEVAKRRPRGWFTTITLTLGEPVPAEEVTAEVLQERVTALWEAGGSP